MTILFQQTIFSEQNFINYMLLEKMFKTLKLSECAVGKFLMETIVVSWT